MNRIRGILAPKPADPRRRVVHVTAEYEPLVKVGGLGEAVRGLVDSLGELGWAMDVVVPDYAGIELDQETTWRLPVPSWAGAMWARRGRLGDGSEVTLVGGSTLRRPHPYTDPSTTESWPDNDTRFFGFSAGAAALAGLEHPAIVHCHDWHAAPALALLNRGPRRVLSVHNFAHQGLAPETWIARIGQSAEPMRVPGGCDALVGGIRMAETIVTVSPTYCREICATSADGLGELLRRRRTRLVGIVNGVDRAKWDPATDARIPFAYKRTDLSGKSRCRAGLLRSIGHEGDGRGPVVAVVSRLAHQKGIDLALSTAAMVASVDGILIVHGAGQREVADLIKCSTAADPRHVVAMDGYDETTAHRIIAGADILLMPSRFEPCGLTQLQALTYGTIPVVTDVGGLHDTVVDADRHRNGTGFVASIPDVEAVGDALGRAMAAHRDRPRWVALQRRAMQHDWSWTQPARHYDRLYQDLLAGGDPCTRR